MYTYSNPHKPNKDGTNREQAEYWLDRAAAFQDDPEKTEKTTEMAFTRALAYEDKAIAAGE